jgi:nucleotide-binding universal stress UspA family protein
MIYRSLLVHLTRAPNCDARVDLAIRLARERDGHLVGLAPTGWIEMPVQIGRSLVGDIDVMSGAWEAMQRHAADAAAQFAERCRGAGLKSFETRVDEADAAASVIRHGHCSDLVLIGQPDPTLPSYAAAMSFAEQVVLYSARPVLCLPYAGRFDAVGRRVLIAWDDSREAARAVSDALPLLTQADEVHLTSFCPVSADAARKDPEALRPICQWLLWHGVDAKPHLDATELPVGEALLSRAADLGTDLIVMGAYGHSRWSERVLGGATRGLLEHMTVPVLMSH